MRESPSLWLLVLLAMRPALAADEAAREIVLASAGSTPRLEAVAGACHGGLRTLRIRRLPEGDPATLPEPWNTLPCGLAKSSEPGWDWSGGEESTSASVRLQPVELKGGPVALLVTVEAGFEHVHRMHALFLPGPKGVTRAWEGDEGQGPTSSTVQVDDGGLVFRTTFSVGEEGVEDAWSLTQVRWDVTRKKLVERPASAWGLILATEDSLERARAAEKELEPRCEGTDLLVTSTGGFPRLTQGKWVVARFFPSRQEAETSRKGLRACAPGAYVKRAR